jgi:hypothetical protein
MAAFLGNLIRMTKALQHGKKERNEGRRHFAAVKFKG